MVFGVGLMVLAMGIGGELYDQLAASGGLTLATVGAVLIAAGALWRSSRRWVGEDTRVRRVDAGDRRELIAGE